MARVLAVEGERRLPLGAGFELALTAAGAYATPEELEHAKLEWIPAPVPGTAAQALEAAGRFSREHPTPLHGFDVWYRAKFEATAAQPGEARALVFDGLATFSEAWLDGEKLLEGANMFVAHAVDVSLHLQASNVLHLVFRALAPKLAAKRPRPRWKPRMLSNQNLRFVRTTLLGHAPGWCPNVDAVGPWRGITLVERDGPLEVRAVDLRTALEDDDGVVALELQVRDDRPNGESFFEVAGVRAPLTAVAGSPGLWRGDVRVPKVPKWWPATHGTPHLVPVSASVNGVHIDLGRTGFRTVELERSNGGFAFRVNGEPFFARGACWSTPDVVSLPGGAEAYEPWLQLAVQAGMNVIRVGGTMAYEGDAFFARCDELGLFVWQDAMLANFDYPAGDPGFLASLSTEIRQLLDRTQASPSLFAVCGGSEIQQQAAMLGAAPAVWQQNGLDEVLERLVLKHRADVAFVAHTPMGGALPFHTGSGVTHYYGVGAYLRPLEDARRAQVTFAAESLAFANVPAPSTVAKVLASGEAPGHHPKWKASVPRDVGASWDFEDVREHYLRALYGVDPLTLRVEEPQRWLELSRAVTGEVMEATFAEWRRPKSGCAGALVFLLQDLRPGAGWGVIDSFQQPKAAWHALRRAFSPVAAFFTDEGLDGLHAHLVNDGAQPLRAVAEVRFLREGKQVVMEGTQPVELPARGGLTLPVQSLLPAFFDATYAYRFGPPAHDVGVLTLRDAAGVRSQAFHFPRGRGLPRVELGLEGTVARDDRGHTLTVKTSRFAQSVHVEDEHFRAEDDWFHLAPGEAKTVRLIPLGSADAVPDGELHALNGLAPARYRSAP